MWRESLSKVFLPGQCSIEIPTKTGWSIQIKEENVASFSKGPEERACLYSS
jgi:hypothetical protein